MTIFTAPGLRGEHIKRTLKQCALTLHHSGELKHLAHKMALRTHAFSDWIRKGRVPPSKAAWLAANFDGVHAEALTGDVGRQTALPSPSRKKGSA